MAYGYLGPPEIKIGICDECDNEGLDDAVGPEYDRFYEKHKKPVFYWFGGDEGIYLCATHLRGWLEKLEAQLNHG